MNLFRSQLNRMRWQVRLTVWLGAVTAGVAVVAFAKLADIALAQFFFLTGKSRLLPFLLGPLIGMLTVWLTRRYFQGSQGSGIPQVIAAAKRIAEGKEVGRLVSLRIAAAKILLGAFALLGGFSAGREGPSVQVAASIMHIVHRLLPSTKAIRAADLILAGGAAGVAAAFNTPLAGIIFGIEELARRIESRTSGVLLGTIILSGVASLALMGNYHYFGRLRIPELDWFLVVPALLGGVMCGLAGGLFNRMVLWPQRQRNFILWRWQRAHPVLFAGACGLAVALIGWASDGVSFGSGYAITKQALAGDIQLPLMAPLARFMATVATYLSGIPGGLFAPSLAVGAAIGSTFCQLTSGLIADPVPVMALCMAGFLAGVTQSPITATTIVMEMIDGHFMVIPLLIVSLVAKAVSSRISPELYLELSKGFYAEPKPDQNKSRET